jgi:hypothetical protein
MNTVHNLQVSAPDKAGYWWWKGKGKRLWDMVEAREIYSGEICLYSRRNWGGYNLKMAKTELPGIWIYIPHPDEYSPPSRGTKNRPCMKCDDSNCTGFHALASGHPGESQ